VGPFILDFYCPREYLAVELDGQVHASVSAQEYDRERDVFLAHFGIMVLRFENKAIFECPDYVMNQIMKHLGWRGNHPGLTATPPSKGGEL
jgi:very-short-patch-repair endonuclease